MLKLILKIPWLLQNMNLLTVWSNFNTMIELQLQFFYVKYLIQRVSHSVHIEYEV